jgi:hypothetical protein
MTCAEEEPEAAPTGLPDEAQDEDIPLGVPLDDKDAERELPGFPEGDIDTAG